MPKLRGKRRIVDRPSNVSASKHDPSRTFTLRRIFAAEIRRRFSQLRKALFNLVVKEDAFGLKEAQRVVNCNPGQLRGSDGKCGPGIGIDVPRNEMPQIRQDHIKEFLTWCLGQGVDVQGTRVQASDLSPTQKEFRQERVDSIPTHKLEDPILTSKDDFILDGTHRWVKHWQEDKEKMVPVMRLDLPVEQALDLMRRFPKALYTENAKGDPTFINNTRFAFHSSSQQVKVFQGWLQAQMDQSLTSPDAEKLFEDYAKAGYKKGAGRAFDQVRETPKSKWSEKEGAFYQGTKDEFLRSSFAQPISVEKVKLLAGRSFDDLENVTSDMSTRMSRVLMDGLVRGDGLKELGKDLAGVVDLGESRALTIARTEIIRAHAEGQLDHFDKLGVQELGVEVEWSTARDEQVCPECESMEGEVYSIDEAHGMIPAHPNCRCCFTPHVPDELTKNRLRRFTRNVFCPTGPGGGVDATCSPGMPKGSKVGDVPEPSFISSQKAKVEANLKAVAELKTLALKGDLHGLESHVGTPSPKVQAYKQALLDATKKEQGEKQEAKQASDLKFVKDLPGSTHPKLMESSTGDQFVLKSGDLGHIKNEIDTDAAYYALGVDVPKSSLTPDGKIAPFLKDAVTLDTWEKGKTDAEVASMHSKIADGFVADALLANWDVVGLNKDNILIKDGKPIRVDNGGGLKYRAMGDEKGSAFGPKVSELETLRSFDKNPKTAEVFKGITEKQIQQQIKDVVAKKEAVLNVVKDPQTKSILEARFKDLESKLSPESPPTSSTHNLNTGEGLAKFLKDNISKEHNFGVLEMQKIAILHPEGIKGGVKLFLTGFNNPAGGAKAVAKQSAMFDALQKVVPPGTDIKVYKSGYKGAEKLGLTKKYGEESFTTFKSTEKEYSSEHHSSAAEQKFASLLTPVKDGESHTFEKGNPFDMPSHMKWKDSLSDGEKEAISSWKGSAATIRKEVAKGELSTTSKNFMSAITKSPPHSGVVYRGISGDYAQAISKQIEDAGVGGYWSDPSPHCMSRNPATGIKFSGGQLMFRILTKTGRPIMKSDGYSSDCWESSCEHEVTGMPGTKYRIHSVSKEISIPHHGAYYKKIGRVITLIEE